MHSKGFISRTLTIILVIAISFTVIYVNVVSGLNSDKDQIEYLADFDAEGLMQLENSDLGEDVDSFFHGISKVFSGNGLQEYLPGQYDAFAHPTPGVNTPPPETI